MRHTYLKNVYPPKFWYACSLILAMGLTSGFSQSRFSTRMAIPDLYDRAADTLFVDVETHNFGVAGLTNVETFAYNHEFSGSNSYLGPTLTWRVGRTQSVHITNRLPDSAGMRTTVHWHGANIPAYTDGGPHQFFDPGESFDVEFPIIEPPTTLWYHPHAEDITYTQVQMGLAGLIIIRENGDPVEAIAPHTYGHDDIPLVLQDIHFNTSTTIDTTKGPGGAPDRTMVTNGVVQPYLELPPQPVRFRILDGSTRNSYMVGFVTDTLDPVGSRIPFYLLSSDGGYLPDSVRMVTSLETSPGIRNGVIVDFSNHAGETLYAMNFNDELRPGIVGSSVNRPPVNNTFLQIRVGNNPIVPIGAIPASLPAIDPLPMPDTSRTILLTGFTKRDTTPLGIDSNQYDFNKINTIVKLGDTEDWTIKNETNVAHPFHIHLIQFYVQSVEDSFGNVCNIGDACFPKNLIGPKDDILVYPGEKITFRATFDTYGRPKPFTGGNLDSAAYMYHCHILTHEDGYYRSTASTLASRAPWGMMQQFAVWDGTTRPTDLERPIEEDMVIFPNPADEVIYLNAESPKMSTVRIYDIQGRLLIEKVLPPFNGSTSIDVSAIDQGMILVEWTTTEGKQIKKIVME